MSRSIPISDSYRRAIFEALVLQIVIGVVSLMILDGGETAQVCGAALLAFWGGAAILIWRHAQTPSKLDLSLLRLGYLPVVLLAGVVIHLVWHVRGFE